MSSHSEGRILMGLGTTSRSESQIPQLLELIVDWPSHFYRFQQLTKEHRGGSEEEGRGLDG